jgi:hypothetical protein
MKLTRKNRSTRRKTCPSATLSTTNPAYTDPGWNPGLRGERLATKRLSHGMTNAANKVSKLEAQIVFIRSSTSAFKFRR